MITSEVQLKAYVDEAFLKERAIPQNEFRARATLLAEVHSTIVETFDNPASSDDLKLFAVKLSLTVSEMTNIIHEAIALAMLGRFTTAQQQEIVEKVKDITDKMKAQMQSKLEDYNNG